jgi:hypothetical protein
MGKMARELQCAHAGDEGKDGQAKTSNLGSLIKD